MDMVKVNVDASRQVRLRDVGGKTVVKSTWLDYERQAVVTFTDGTFLTLTAKRSYDDFDLLDDQLPKFDHDRDEAISLGFITAEEWDAQKAEIEAKAVEFTKESRRQLYERLVAEFGPPQG